MQKNDRELEHAGNNQISRCGYVALIGRPNVGKSTLLNSLVGQKISITTRKPQTTRHQILGIVTENNCQMVYVDTPGLHKDAKKVMNKYMVQTALDALNSVDVIVFVVDATRWTDEDSWIVEKLRKAHRPIILAINKVDKFKDKELLLPKIQYLSEQASFVSVIPISARTKTNLKEFAVLVEELMPESPHLFPSDQVTDRSERFIAAE